ncbi:MAG: hypothetical protein HYS15_00455 [Candidatus Spechtbacteria bacterium]|nr:hypothetical protein [Candidatus Spechtbacteria bacterium]
MNNMNKLYQLLRMSDDSVLLDLDKKMSVISGKSGVCEKIEEENDWRMRSTLSRLGITSENPKSREVYGALLRHLAKSEERLRIFLNGGGGKEFTNFPELLRAGRDLMNPKKVWVLKKEKFREILEANPPPRILQKFGYKDGKELFQREKLEEVASSLRFMEAESWMHEVFERAYLALRPSDFEEREVEAIVLSQKWLEATKIFVQRKRHNLSHLKELGLIFIIPIEIVQAGELMRVFTLYLHYLYEVQFYSELFKKLEKASFSTGLISLLRGDILETAPVSDSAHSFNWLIVQRYLAKDDEQEKRLFMPHVNPEAIHWRKAEEAIASLDKEDLSLALTMWLGLDWVGGYFKDGGKNELISFDLIDTVMSLVEEKDMLKYLYHQQEALWNRIFEGYMGDDGKLEELIKENILKGYIALP